MIDTSLLLETLVGNKLQAIWSHAAHQKFCKWDFMAPYQVQPGAILFVGINPSFTEADTNIRYYNAHKGSHPYFKPMKEIAEAAGKPWMHLDLLYFRETQQDKLWDMVKSEAGLGFVWQQLQLFPELLAAAQPSAVVVANADARKLLGVDYDPAKDGENNKWLWPHFEWNKKWDDELGTYRHNGTPFFFSSMLSGQRALDKGSRQRLKWHIKQALNSQK